MELKATRQYSIATVIKYDTYQPKENGNETQTEQQVRNRRETDEIPMELPNKEKKVKKEKKVNNYPDWLDLEIWKEYKNYRQSGKGKFTPYAQGLAIDKLDKLRQEGNDPTEVIKRSIECGWSGLFPLKENSQKTEAQKWLEQA